jgi:hypothetical protein
MSVTDTTKQRFLDQLATGATVRNAAGDESTRRRLYELRHTDADFAAAWRTAEDEGTDLLEEEAQRRAVEGVPRETFDKDGNLIRRETVYSDTLLILLLKARRPEKYRDNAKVEHAGDPDKPVVVEHRGVKLSDIIVSLAQQAWNPETDELDLGELYPALRTYCPILYGSPSIHEHPQQCLFLLLDEREAFYGGAAGGGKSARCSQPRCSTSTFPATAR